MPRTRSRQLDREIADVLAGRTARAWSVGRVDDISHAEKRRGRGQWRGTEVQALLFLRPRWKPSEAKKWAKDHDFNHGKVHVTDNYVRLRQFDPTPGAQKRTITFGDGIKAVIEQVK